VNHAAWALHPQLDADTTPVGDLALCRVVAIDDAVYPWLVLVPRRAAITEIAALDDGDAARLMAEIALASRVLKAVTGCDKLNIAAIGNVVPQLHIHIVARWRTDPLWPKPVWGLMRPTPGEAARFERFLREVRAGFGLEPAR
jgi:diadenosine tetraphosphate (Ap4A) HIT family hydrolase